MRLTVYTSSDLALTPGTRLGAYEITAQIGEGGMGQVYRATDTKLKRQVAIKMLPPALAADRDRLARFQREAEVLASLNHPNIAAIYGLEESAGTTALVMELVEGEDLSQRLVRGAIPIDEALPIAKQIAEALEAAHERGIIHRDLKPANIKVRADGTVKVLDFGLAKALEPPAASSPGMSQSPTITTPAMTQAGMILGTAAYMSPEQARGKTVDKRADIWAFGCVFYEMLAGRRAFSADDVSLTLAEVLKSEPDWGLLPVLPLTVSAFLRQCLKKDPRQRTQAIGDVRLALEGAFDSAIPRSHATAVVSRERPRVWMAAFGVAAVTALALAVPELRRLREPAAVAPAAVRFEIPALGSAPAQMFRLSPDGRLLVFVAPGISGNQLWIRPLDSLESKALPGTDGATYPFWSPDGRYLGFFAQGKLKKIPVTGGPPQTVCDAATGRGGTWNPDGVIVFSPGPVGPLYRVSAGGGVPTPATKAAGAGEGHRYPEFLPDGRHFLYSILGRTGTAMTGLHVGSLDGGDPVRLLPDETSAGYAPPVAPESSGVLLFRRNETLMAQPFDPVRLQTTGEMFPVAEQIGETGNIGSGAFSVAAGVLAFRNAGNENRELVWVDRTGRRGAVVTKPFRSSLPNGLIAALSPDEGRVAFSALSGSYQDLFLLNLEGGELSRFTFGPNISSYPVWSPDGANLLFNSRTPSSGASEIYLKPVTGGDARLLLRLDDVANVQPLDWSPDGKFVLYSVTSAKTANDLWLLPMSGDSKPVPYLETPATESNGQFSPDGRWMAYVSNESGPNQVFVQPVPASGAKWQVSTAGGIGPRWRRDGTELYYMAPNGTLMAVPVKSGASFEARTPLPLPVTTVVSSNSSSSYAVTRDGQRFLVTVPAGEETAAPPITVTLNWQAGLPKP